MEVGGTGTDLDGIEWVWNVWDGYVGLGWVERARDWIKGPRVGVKGQGRIYFGTIKLFV